MFGVTEIQLIILICYSSGNYSVTYSDTFGCSETQNFQINEPITPLNIISNVQHVTCNGSNNGQITYLLMVEYLLIYLIGVMVILPTM